MFRRHLNTERGTALNRSPHTEALDQQAPHSQEDQVVTTVRVNTSGHEAVMSEMCIARPKTDQCLALALGGALARLPCQVACMAHRTESNKFRKGKGQARLGRRAAALTISSAHSSSTHTWADRRPTKN